MNVTVLAFQVQKRTLDEGNAWIQYGGTEGPWVYVCRFATLSTAQEFIAQNKDDYIGDPQRCELRVYCDPRDVAKLMASMNMPLRSVRTNVCHLGHTNGDSGEGL